MAVFNGAFPVLPGKVDTARAFAKETMGPRRSGYDESQKRGGITRETWSVQETPDGSGSCWCGSRAPIPRSPSRSLRRNLRTSPCGSTNGSRKSAASTSPSLRKAAPSSSSIGTPELIGTDRFDASRTARYELIEWILGRSLRGVDVDPSSRRARRVAR